MKHKIIGPPLAPSSRRAISLPPSSTSQPPSRLRSTSQQSKSYTTPLIPTLLEVARKAPPRLATCSAISRVEGRSCCRTVARAHQMLLLKVLPIALLELSLLADGRPTSLAPVPLHGALPPAPAPNATISTPPPLASNMPDFTLYSSALALDYHVKSKADTASSL